MTGRPRCFPVVMLMPRDPFSWQSGNRHLAQWVSIFFESWGPRQASASPVSSLSTTVACDHPRSSTSPSSTPASISKTPNSPRFHLYKWWISHLLGSGEEEMKRKSLRVYKTTVHPRFFILLGDDNQRTTYNDDTLCSAPPE